MVISKCVPLAVSRKRFSEFVNNTKPEDMVFVGYRTEIVEDGQTKKTVNVKMPYSTIKEDILSAIKEDPEWGQGGTGNPGGNGGNGDGEHVCPPVTFEIKSYTIAAVFNEEGDLIHCPSTWVEDENTGAETNLINLGNTQGFVEINSGGDYVEDFIYFINPAGGLTTTVVIDNTGLPYVDVNGKKYTTEEGLPYIRATKPFTLYYGLYTPDGLNDTFYEIMTVQPNHRGVVQFLHTEESKLDIVVHASESVAYDKLGEVITGDESYYADYITNDTETNLPENFTPQTEGNNSEFDIDMDQKKGYLEFVPKGGNEYTFWFSNTEIGSSTFIVIDNTAENSKPVSIWYGKRMDEKNLKDDVKYEVTKVERERCVIQVFHSLSADIIVKVTKA